MAKLTAKQRNTQIAAIHKAIDIVGGRTNLAKIISKNTKKEFARYRIDDYLNQGMPPIGALYIYQAADKKVDLDQLDPLHYNKRLVVPVERI